jgi:cytidine deaminase
MSANDDWGLLLKAAVLASKAAYAPYSGVAVGAALVCTDGTVFSSANMENASYGLSLCAETGAIHQASSAGRLADIQRIAVVGGPRDGRGGGGLVTPCGRCRQLISEAAQLGQTNIQIACGNADGSDFVVRSIDELLPHAFGPASLAP